MKKFIAVLTIVICNFVFGQSLMAEMRQFAGPAETPAPAAVYQPVEVQPAVDVSVSQPEDADFDPLEAVKEEAIPYSYEEQQQQAAEAVQTHPAINNSASQDDELKRLRQRIEEIKQQQAAKQAAQPETVQVKIGDITILPPLPGNQPRFTDGEIMVAMDQIGQTGFADQAMMALNNAKTRTEQENAVLQYASPNLKATFEAARNQSPQSLMDPKDFAPMTDEKQALNLAAVKQPFVDFPGWGENPFGPPAKSWQDLRDHFSAYMMAVIERTYYPADMKAYWADTLKAVLKSGPDGTYSEVVNLQNWPLWQWTAGRIPGTMSGGRVHGVNIRYTNGPAYGLAIFLRKYGMWVIHGFPCRGNPIVPFTGTTTFSVTRDEKVSKPATPPPPTATCVSANVKVVGDMIHVTADFMNPDQLPLTFIYSVDGREIARTASNAYDFPVTEYREGQRHVVDVKVLWSGGESGCPAGLTSSFVIPPPPPPPAKTDCKCKSAKSDVSKLKRSELDRLITITPKLTGDRVSAIWTKADGTPIPQQFIGSDLSLHFLAGQLLPVEQHHHQTRLHSGTTGFRLTVTSRDGKVTVCEVRITVSGAKIWPWLVLAAVVIAVVVIIIITHGAAAPVATKIAIPVTGV